MSDQNRRRLSLLPPSAVPISSDDMRAAIGAKPQANNDFRSAIAAYLELPGPAIRLASSGRTTIYALLRGLMTENPARQQVVIPAYTCPVLPKVALDLGLEPIFVDIDPETTHYQREHLVRKVGSKTLAVFLVHPFGIPLPLSDVQDIAREAGAVVIEDAAQALGARWMGKPVGTTADYGVFSLGPGKPVSTGGGGIAVTGREENVALLNQWWAAVPPASSANSIQAWLRQAIFRLAFHPYGWWAATRLGLQRLGNEESSWGYTVRQLSAAQSAVGTALLPRLDTINARRQEVASSIAAAAGQAPAVKMLNVDSRGEPIYLRLPLLADSEGRRESLIAQMWSAGIGAGRLYEKTLPAIFDPGSRSSYPGAELFAHRLLTLPTHYHVTAEDIRNMKMILTRS